HINRELGADFDLSAFRHRVDYNTRLHCIEMYLDSLREQVVSVSGRQFRLAASEAIRTERSFKYDVEEFRAWVVRTGLAVRRVWPDERRLFAVLLLTAT